MLFAKRVEALFVDFDVVAVALSERARASVLTRKRDQRGGSVPRRVTVAPVTASNLARTLLAIRRHGTGSCVASITLLSRSSFHCVCWGGGGQERRRINTHTRVRAASASEAEPGVP